MESSEVRIVRLEPMRVASAHAFGPSPEREAFGKLLPWARAKGLWGATARPRLFGFNNPDPAIGSPNYGYEVWLEVGPEARSEGEIRVKQFTGGLYAVSRCTSLDSIFGDWQRLVAWAERSPYRPVHRQCLEEHVEYDDEPGGRIVIDLYLPIAD